MCDGMIQHLLTRLEVGSDMYGAKVHEMHKYE